MTSCVIKQRDKTFARVLLVDGRPKD